MAPWPLPHLASLCVCVGLISFELPAEVVSETGLEPYQLRALSIVQASLLTLIAVSLGYWATPRLGLRSIIVDGHPPFGAAMLAFPAIGLVCGVAFWGADTMLAEQLPVLGSFLSAHESQLADLEALATPVMRLAYGGVTEEILARYGLLSGVAMAANMLLKHRISAPLSCDHPVVASFRRGPLAGDHGVRSRRAKHIPCKDSDAQYGGRFTLRDGVRSAFSGSGDGDPCRFPFGAHRDGSSLILHLERKKAYDQFS